MKKTLGKYFKKPWFVGLLSAVVLVIAGTITYAYPSESQHTTVAGEDATNTKLTVVGKVKSAQVVDLAFVNGGKIAAVSKTVGDKVQAGDILIALDSSVLRANLVQAQAQVAYQQTLLKQLQKNTNSDLQASTTLELTKAQSALQQAQVTLLATLQNAYASTQDAIYNKTDEFFINPRSNNPELVFPYSAGSDTSIESGRVEVEHRLQLMSDLMSTATTSQDMSALSTQIKVHIAEAKLFLDSTAFTINAVTPSATISEATITKWETDVAAARTEVNDALTGILAADQKLTLAETALTTAQAEFNLEKNQTVADQIKSEQAKIAIDQAMVLSILAAINDMKIKSPIAGIVTKQDGKLGEIAQPNVPVASVISDADFEVEAPVAETDITKIRIGEAAQVTLDAYGPHVVFQAVVVAINPTETTINGISTYTTTLQFDQKDERIKSGMTAHVTMQE